MIINANPVSVQEAFAIARQLIAQAKANVLVSRPCNTAFIDGIAATALFHILVHTLTALAFGEPQFALSGVASVT